MEVRLVVWGAFGAIGFISFVLLIELLRRFSSHSNGKAADIKVQQEQDQQPLLLVRDFTHEQLHKATSGFAESNLLLASNKNIYWGLLEDGERVVVKCFDNEQEAGLELEALSSHPRMAPLLGTCNSLQRERKAMLVYKRMPNGDLASALRRSSSRTAAGAVEVSSVDSDESSSKSSIESSASSSSNGSKPLDWITRFKIAIGIAEAIVYLHHERSPPLIHSDLKSSSILLDNGYEVRLSSMGKACRYHAFADASSPSVIVDVYCYGKLLLDLISGLDVSGGCDAMAEAWLNRALPVIEGDHDAAAFLSLVDPSLVVDEDHVKEVMLLAAIARSCIDPAQAQQQTMISVLARLQNPSLTGM